MKKTWCVYVGMNEGHEYNNTITFADWFGPFTEKQAKNLEKRLNKILVKQADGDCEHNAATAMCLEELSPREVVAKIQNGNFGAG